MSSPSVPPSSCLAVSSRRQTFPMLFPVLLIVFSPMGIDLFLPSLPHLATVFAATPDAMQWTISAFVLAMGFGQMPFGGLSDRFGRKKISILGLAIFIIGSLMALLAEDILQLSIARFIQGLGASATTVCAFSIIRDQYEGDAASGKFSWLGGALNLVPSMAPILGAVILATYDWQGNFVFYVISAAAVLVVCLLFQKETADFGAPIKKGAKDFLPNLWTVIKQSKSWPAALICISSLGFIITHVSLSPIILINVLGLSPLVFSYFFAGNAIFICVACFSVETLNARFGVVRMINTGLIISLLCAGLLIAVGLMGLTSPWHYMLPINLGSIGFSFSLGNAMGVAMNPHGRLVGTASGLLGAMQMGLAGIIAALVLLADQGQVFVFGMIFMVIFMVVAGYWFWDMQTHRPNR